MKYLIAFIALVACGGSDSKAKTPLGRFDYQCSRSGVVYIIGDTGMAVLVDKDGRPVPCE